MEQAEIPGASIAVIEDRAIVWHRAFGTLGAQRDTAVNDETIFAAASLSKPLFAYAVLRLVDREKFELDRPLFHYLEYERLQHDARYTQLTARHVLTHTTGLPNWGGPSLDFRRDPGAAFGYSGEGFVFLQRAVEAHTGLTLEQLTMREVFEPLGMTRSSYIWRPRFEGNAVTGLDRMGREQPMPRNEEGNAAASLKTTARDYAAFVVAMLESEGLAHETASAMLAPVSEVRGSEPSATDGYVHWGLGWGLQDGPRGKAFFHWGDNGGFKAYVIAYPETGDGIVYFANASDGLSIISDLVGSYFEDEHWAVHWLDYERYDAPERLARKSLEHAFIDEGIDAGLQLMEQFRSRSPNALDYGTIRTLGSVLRGREHFDAAIAVFDLNARTSPDSIDAHRLLGETFHEAGRYQAAIAAYTRALALDPNSRGDRARLEWIRERLEVEQKPVILTTGQMLRVVGNYGPRHISLHDDVLFYQRDGNPAYRIVPLAADVFALEGLETFRMRFEFDERGQAAKIIGLYINGNRDESSRTP